MDSANYRNLFKCLKKKIYPEGFTKQDKTTLRKFAKKFEYYSKLESLLYVAKEEDQHSASTTRLVFVLCLPERENKRNQPH